MPIRCAILDDLEAINDIYNYFVLRSTCTYQIEPETLDGRLDWFNHRSDKHPIIVATDETGTLVGWGVLRPFHARAAYSRTVENSIYVHPDHQRKGIGRALLAELIARARIHGYHTIIACIDAEQLASLAFHADAGFTQVARLHEVGRKFDRWLDVIYMQKML